MKTAFVSGHLDLTQKEFGRFYYVEIQLAVLFENKIVVGDARGTDTMAQKLVEELGRPDLLTIYHMFDSPRNSVKGAKLIGGFKSDEERDAAMTADSDYDIAWVREGREKSGTQRNLNRREAKNSH
jgi:hypothetical protein